MPIMKYKLQFTLSSQIGGSITVMMFSPKAWPDSSTAVVKPMHSLPSMLLMVHMYIVAESVVPSVLRAVGHQRIIVNLVDSLRCYHSSSASSVEALTSSSDISCTVVRMVDVGLSNHCATA